MLPTPTSTSPNPRPTCTGIAARYHAGSLFVCREGSVVALHIGTPEGTVLVTMRERDFVRGARGPRDHNGHPFRTIEQLDEERRAKEGLPPAESSPADPAPEKQIRVGSPETAEKCARGWQLYQNDPRLSVAEAAKQAGVPYPTLSEYIRYNHSVEAKKLRADRGHGGRWART